MESWIPLLVALVATAGASLAYVFQKHADRKHELITRRRQTYSDFLAALNKQITHGHLANLISLNVKRAEMFLVASDNVATSTGKFFEYQYKTNQEESLQGSANNESINLTLRYYAEMVLAMRQDCFEKSKLNIDQTINCMPVYYSSAKESITVK